MFNIYMSLQIIIKRYHYTPIRMAKIESTGEIKD